MAQVTGYFFGPLIPEKNSSVASDDIDTSLEAFQNRAEDVRILKFGHEAQL